MQTNEQFEYELQLALTLSASEAMAEEAWTSAVVEQSPSSSTKDDLKHHQERRNNEEYIDKCQSGQMVPDTEREQQVSQEQQVLLENMKADEDQDQVCCICCSNIQLLDLALIPSCTHQFCIHCVLSWSTLKSTCPLCKSSFSTLFVHRNLDGSPLIKAANSAVNPAFAHLKHDSFHGWAEEPVALLKRATWVQLQTLSSPKDDILSSFNSIPSMSGSSGYLQQQRASVSIHGAFQSNEAQYRPSTHLRNDEDDDDDYDDYEYDDYNDIDDQPVAGWSSSNSKSKATKQFGNRPRGSGGYMRAGHMMARPASSSRDQDYYPASDSASKTPEKNAPGRRARRRNKHKAQDAQNAQHVK